MQIAVVTPVFNGTRFLDEAILSVVTQAGDFTIRYHVQDGGSTDGTIEKLAHWKSRLRGDFPVFCRGVDFTYASEPDGGIYDAINRGFAVCGEPDLMAWINGDDRFEPGAFASVVQILTRNSDIDWLCDRVTLMDDTGAMIHSFPVVPFPRKAIAAGVFDGRSAPSFIQQEGSFWRADLWHRAGRLNSTFRLAGDFDLWRRFAAYTDMVVADAIFGWWRRVDGQASANKEAYWAEIDSSLSDHEKNMRSAISIQFRKASKRGSLLQDGFAYRVVTRPDYGDWTCEIWPKNLAVPKPERQSMESRNDIDSHSEGWFTRQSKRTRRWLSSKARRH